MANEKQYPMTAAGKTKLEKELEFLITVKRPEVVERIKEARSHGDLSENSEYDSAKEDQGFIEGRISEIETMLRNAVVITEADDDTVSLGKAVTVKFLAFDEEDTYTIVGSAEADALENRISNDSPMTKALLGHKVNDIVKYPSPGGEMEVQILKIETAKAE